MKVFVITGLLVLGVFFIVGMLLVFFGKKSENRMIEVFEQDPTAISNDAREFLKIEGYHNTRYNQKMLEDFQVYRNFKYSQKSN